MSPNFGTAYISNSAAGGSRTGRGLYSVLPDQSGHYGNVSSDTAAAGDSTFSPGASASTPYRITVTPDGSVYVAGWADSLANVWRMPADLSTTTQLLTGTLGPSVPTGENHGSVSAVYVTGSTATNDLTLYTSDEDLTTNFVTGSGSTADSNSIWKYAINGGPLPATAMPTKVNIPNPQLAAATTDLDRGADGKFYLAQDRNVGTEAGVMVFSADGQTVLFNSLTASRTLLGNPTANDILRNVQGMAISPDQKWMAPILNNSDVAVVPLINGIPDIANPRVVDTGTNVNSGRDIAFDAADNIHYVSSGQALYRVLSLGGSSDYVTSWDGTSFSFTNLARSLYWDINGTTTGAGGATPGGVWDGITNNFNTDSTAAAAVR